MKETTWNLPRSGKEALGMAERIAHKGCDFLAANPAMAGALGSVAPHVATACGMLKT